MITDTVFKSETPMIQKLLHLRIACYLYNQISDNDNSLIYFFKNNPILELSNETQIEALIKWLRNWGCRQFKKNNRDISVKSIQEWRKQSESIIPNRNVFLVDYDLKKNKDNIVNIFNNLSERKASERQLKSSASSNVTIGPVGTAKTLFTLRPNLFAPWDNPIIDHFELDHNGSGYVEYLSQIQNELINIKNSLNSSNETTWDELFNCLNKKHRFYPKLIDEYYWMTITKKIKPSELELMWPYKKE